MKKNYFLAIAVAALMLATTVAQASDITFSGQIRPRFISDNDSSDATSSANVFDTRVRLNAKANVNANTSVFLQFQSVGNWGTTDADRGGTRISQGGGVGAGGAAQASDELSDVGFHQAYLTLKNFLGQAVDAKIGRQEVVLDGHRLFGHTGWTTGGETKDAIRLTHTGGNHTLNYIYIEGRNQDGAANSNDGNEQMHVFHSNTQGIMGGNLSGYFVITDDQSEGLGGQDENLFYTIGARQKGKAAGLDYRVEYYHQFGDGAVPGHDQDWRAGYTNTNLDGAEIDRDAHMFGIRVGKTFTNVSWKPSITLWFDTLSGTDDEDIAGNDYGGFDTLSDTGHKFYGFQDFFLNAETLGTGGYGLQDLAIKTKMSPKAGWTLKADYHFFSTQTDTEDGDSDTMRTNEGTAVSANSTLLNAVDSDLGQELDITLVHKYDSNTKIVAGYSHYWTTETFSQLNGAGSTAGGNDGSDWMYVMMDTKF
jgi:hypothetical protein